MRRFAILALLLTSCDAQSDDRTFALFELPTAGATDLFALPYPNDIRRNDDGTIDLSPLPDLGAPVLVKRFVAAIAERDHGFSSNGAAFFRFSGPIEVESLPRDAIESLGGGSALRLVNIDPESPAYGEAVPLTWRFTERATNFAGANLLAALPVPGFSLLPNTTYAALLSDGVVDPNGAAVTSSDVLRQLLADTLPPATDGIPGAAMTRAHARYAPLRAFMARFGLTGVIGAAVFTTGNHTALMPKLRDVVAALPPPVAEALLITRETERYYEVQGSYVAPNFQSGVIPFASPEEGGTIELDEAGLPRIARRERLRFALSVPKGKMPAAGWPIVLYAHGTGGNYRSCMRNGTASQLSHIRHAGQTIGQAAVACIDQTLHGPRGSPQLPAEITFINVLNPRAAVDNVIQGAADNFALRRMVANLRMRRVPRSDGGGPAFDYEVRFDGARVAFIGHSQGGLTGAVYLPNEPLLRGAVLSGVGANTILGLLYKTEPIDTGDLFRTAAREPVDEYHPMATLVQQLLDPSDPANYAPLFFRRPRAEVGAKHVFISQGIIDHLTPAQATDALAVAAGIPTVGPVLRPIASLALRGVSPQPLPASANVNNGEGSVSAGVLQYRGIPWGGTCERDSDCDDAYCSEEGQCRSDGHYVLFESPAAIHQHQVFIGTLLGDGPPLFVEADDDEIRR